METEVRLQNVAARPLAVVRRRASMQELSRVVPEACGLVWNVVRAQPAARPGRHVAVYFDNEMNLEVGVEIDGSFTPDGEVLASALPAGAVATATHIGPYGSLKKTHERIHEWCRQHGKELIRPCWEVYAHWQDEWNDDPSRIRTDVFYLIKPDTSKSG